MHRRWWILVAAAAAVVLLVVAVEPALAQGGDPSKAGDNFSKFLRSILTPVVFTLAAAILIVAAFRRDWGLAFSIIGLVLLIASFLIPNTPWRSFTENVAKQVLGDDGGEPRGRRR
jgi:hypothetical protein